MIVIVVMVVVCFVIGCLSHLDREKLFSRHIQDRVKSPSQVSSSVFRNARRKNATNSRKGIEHIPSQPCDSKILRRDNALSIGLQVYESQVPLSNAADQSSATKHRNGSAVG